MAFAHVDDLWTFTPLVGHKTKLLAQVLRVTGHLLLGYDGWSRKKAITDGFFSSVHKYTLLYRDGFQSACQALTKYFCSQWTEFRKTLTYAYKPR